MNRVLLWRQKDKPHLLINVSLLSELVLNVFVDRKGSYCIKFRDCALQDALVSLEFVICDQIINILKPTGHVKYQQFNIQQFYVLPTLYLSILYLSENKRRLVPLTA